MFHSPIELDPFKPGFNSAAWTVRSWDLQVSQDIPTRPGESVLECDCTNAPRFSVEVPSYRSFVQRESFRTVKMNSFLKNYNCILRFNKFSIVPVLRKEILPAYCLRHYSDESKKKGPVTWRTLGITAFIGVGLGVYMRYLKESKEAKIIRERQRALGKASIGGQFELIDHKKRKRSSSDFLGKWLLIYFGFTHCPDVCPDELEKIVDVVNQLDKIPDVPKVIPIFITVDPKRDTPEVVGKYIKEFSPKLVGLTGTVQQIEKVCKAYRVYFSAGPRDESDDYIVDHTIIAYLVNPKGEFVDYYGQTKTASEVKDSILINMAKQGDLSKKGSWWK